MSLSGAKDLLSRAKQNGADKVLVALSGGKDSLAILDLSVECFGKENVECFFMYLVAGLRCVETHVDSAARRYGVTVHKLPHWSTMNNYRHGTFMPPGRAKNMTRNLSITDVEAWLTKKTGISWFVYGQRMDESLERRGMLHKIKGLSFDFKRAYPLWDWGAKDVFAYLRAKRIAMPDNMDRGLKSSGIDLRPHTLIHIKNRYPDDYRKILEVFPYAEVQVKRLEIYGESIPHKK